ncbi:MAG: hypothetical protein H7840_03420 [Alphaproteobacteria bacterium]
MKRVTFGVPRQGVAKLRGTMIVGAVLAGVIPGTAVAAGDNPWRHEQNSGGGRSGVYQSSADGDLYPPLEETEPPPLVRSVKAAAAAAPALAAKTGDSAAPTPASFRPQADGGFPPVEDATPSPSQGVVRAPAPASAPPPPAAAPSPEAQPIQAQDSGDLYQIAFPMPPGPAPYGAPPPGYYYYPPPPAPGGATDSYPPPGMPPWGSW